MENTTPSAFKSALKFGLILAVISILYSLLLYSLGLFANKYLGFVSLLILLGMLIWGIKDYRDKKAGGFVSLGKAFAIGFYIGLIYAVISAIYTFVFFKYFDPEMVVKMMADAEEKLVQSNPNMDESQIETAMSYTRKFMSPTWMAMWGLIMNLIFSAVLSIIVAAVMKKEENSMQHSV